MKKPICIAVLWASHVVLVATMLLVMSQGTSGLWLIRAAPDWPRADGEILTAAISETSGARGATAWCPHWTYRYAVNGRSYVGERAVLEWQQCFSSPEGADAQLRMRPVGSRVPVIYNPAQPRQAALQITGNEGWQSTIWLSMGAAGSLAALASFIRLRRRGWMFGTSQPVPPAQPGRWYERLFQRRRPTPPAPLTNYHPTPLGWGHRRPGRVDARLARIPRCGLGQPTYQRHELVGRSARERGGVAVRRSQGGKDGARAMSAALACVLVARQHTLRRFGLLIVLLVASIGARADVADAQAATFIRLYTRVCLKHLHNLAELRAKLAPLPKFPADQAKPFVHDKDADAWPVPDKVGHFVVVVARQRPFCAVYGREANTELVKAEFAQIVDMAPAPLVATQIDQKEGDGLSGRAETVFYEWRLPNAPIATLFGLTTDATGAAGLKAMATASINSK